jgi:hypothetical protein
MYLLSEPKLFNLGYIRTLQIRHGKCDNFSG